MRFRGNKLHLLNFLPTALTSAPPQYDFVLKCFNMVEDFDYVCFTLLELFFPCFKFYSIFSFLSYIFLFFVAVNIAFFEEIVLFKGLNALAKSSSRLYSWALQEVPS